MSDEKAKAVQETAKAVGQIAKTVESAIEAYKEAKDYFDEILGKPAGALSDIVEQNLRFLQWRNLNYLARKAQEISARMRAQGYERQVPAKLLLPLVENAALEENDDLRDLYARLLASATDSRQPAPRSALSDIVRQMEPIDAVLLKGLFIEYLYQTRGYDFPEDFDICTDNYPERLAITCMQFRVSFDNLRRLGLADSFFEKIKAEPAFLASIVAEEQVSVHGGYSKVRMTALGLDFMKSACYGDAEIDEIKTEMRKGKKI